MDLIQQVYQTSEKEILRDGNRLYDAQKIEESYELFRERFGPDKLEILDGELLLETLFNRFQCYGTPLQGSHYRIWLERNGAN